MADVLGNLYSWSTTAGSNYPQGSTVIGTGWDDNLREIQKVVRYTHSRDTIASAATCDLGSKEAMSLDITGTTTITSLGTVSAGIRKWVTFQDTLTLTHNVTSLRLPSATSITTAYGDTACFESLGAGNWVCLGYSRYNGQQVSLNTTFGDGSVSAPSIAFTADTNTGIYRPAADSIAFATNGAQQVLVSPSSVTISTPAASGATGSISITAGASSADDGGSISITAGNGGSGSGDTGGSVTITSGTGLINGDISLNAGNDINLTSGLNGDVRISTGSYAGGSIGHVFIAGADGTTGLAGSKVDISSGGGAGGGGDIILNAGGGTTYSTTQGGNVSISGGIGGGNNYYGRVELADQAGLASFTVYGKDGHVEMSEELGTPTLTSGAGTGATISGNDNGFRIVLGVSPSTTIVVTFVKSWTNVPMPMVNYGDADIAVRALATTSTVTLYFASSPTQGKAVDVICFGWRT